MNATLEKNSSHLKEFVVCSLWFVVCGSIIVINSGIVNENYAFSNPTAKKLLN